MTAIHTCADSDDAYLQAVIAVMDALTEKQRRVGRATLILPGGNTVREFIRHAIARRMDWHGIQVILADERWVAVDHPDSNERLLRELLPKDVPLIGLKCSADTPAKALGEITRRLRPFGPPFDVAFLGIGADGHFASLFPRGPELEVSGIVVATVPPAASHSRVSLTLPALLQCGQIISVMTGDKRETLRQALDVGDPRDMPVRLLLAQDQTMFRIFTH